MAEITKQIGQLFIVGFSGEKPPAAFLDFAAEAEIGGVILFDEACATGDLTRQNIERIRAQYPSDARPFVAIDQEGGRVCRLKGAPAEYRSAREYGRKAHLEAFQEDYQRAAVYMESLGINLNLAPVADVFIEPRNQCLEERCFGETVDGVVPFVETVVRISKRCGILSCLKHFPGLGAALLDPHEQVPVIDYDEVVWHQRELKAFAAGVEQGADMVMTTHVRLEGFDDVIVTGSKRIISLALRKDLAFDGPVITDDLTMKGAEPLGHMGERAVAALHAGHDILLFGKDFEAAMRAYDYVISALDHGEIEEACVRSALSRVSGIKLKLDRPVLR